MSDQTVERASQSPRSVHVANLVGRLLDPLGLRASLGEASLVRAARRRTGLHFFGDSGFRVPLRAQLHSFENEARLHPLGRFMARAMLVEGLGNRLRVQALRDRRPEIFQIDVDRPIFIVGLDRVGGGFLQRMLAEHPALRPLRTWEALYPVPFAGRGRAVDGADPRHDAVRFAERALRYLARDSFIARSFAGEGLADDSRLFEPGFFSPTVEALANVPSFAGSRAEADARPAYEDFRAIIQVLLSQRGGRWIGHGPFHLEHLGALLATFPDGRIIQIHRDPLEPLAASCGLTLEARRLLSDEVDPREIGSQWLARTELGLAKAMAERARLPSDLFLDVHYGDLVADPMKQLQRVCDFVHAPLDPEGIRSIERAARRGAPRDQDAPHVAPGAFGIDVEQVAAAFGEYRERFGL